MTNELYFGGNRGKAKFNGAGDGSASATIPNAIDAAFAAAGIPELSLRWPQWYVSEFCHRLITNLGVFDSQFRYAGTTVLGDNFSWTHNTHSFKTVLKDVGSTPMERTTLPLRSIDDVFPTTFNFPLLLQRGGAMSRAVWRARFRILPRSLRLDGSPEPESIFDKAAHRVDQDYRGFRTREIDLYFEDTWKLRPNLTLNLGLRWEYKGVPYEVNGQLSNLIGQDPSSIEPTGGFVFSLVGKNSGTSNLLYQKDWNNFGPRVGFAYSPNWSSDSFPNSRVDQARLNPRRLRHLHDRVYGNLFGNARGNPPFQQDFQEIPST